MLQSGRPGFYVRVLEEGDVGPGDTILRLTKHPVGLTVRQMSNLLYFEKDDMDGARRALQINALSPGWRQSFETRFVKAKRT
jgi:MOSC domain-containing protein YiiM